MYNNVDWIAIIEYDIKPRLMSSKKLNYILYLFHSVRARVC